MGSSLQGLGGTGESSDTSAELFPQKVGAEGVTGRQRPEISTRRIFRGIDLPKPKKKRHVPGERQDAPGLPHRRHESGPETRTEQAIAQSVSETIAATSEWLAEEIAVLIAHCVMPGAGHVILLIFEAKELLGDAGALMSSNRPVELQIPLAHLPPGVIVEAGVQIGDGGQEDGGQLTVFVAPGQGGVLGGWALEQEKDQETQPEKQTEREAGTVIPADLSRVLAASQDSREVAAILRGIAARLESQLRQMDEYHAASSITIYDDQADLGLWLTQSRDAGSAWKIIKDDADNSGLIVKIVQLVA
jgi:hypothetical protein